jgi:tetratricopeptide (TPR) repeat protein
LRGARERRAFHSGFCDTWRVTLRRAARRSTLLTPCVAVLAVLGACSGGEAPAARVAEDQPTTLSSREVIDTADAIEKFLNAGRAREAVLLARRFTDRAPAGSAAAVTAGELRARACFTWSQLPDTGLTREERAALAAEAAEWAARGVRASGGNDVGDSARVAFAALLCSGAGRHDDARRLFDRALELAPDDADILLQATMSALGAEELARARALLARRRAVPSATDGWNEGLEAEILLASAEYGAAVGAAQRAVAADRDRLEFRLILARALRRDGRPADAARLLSALDDAERAKPAIAEQHARALAESGDAAGAARAWDLAVRANPADSFVRAEAVLAFHHAGDAARAAAELALLEAMPGGASDAARVRAALAARGSSREDATDTRPPGKNNERSD